MQYLDRIQAHAKAKNLDGAQHRRGGAISNKFGRGRATLKKQALAFASVLVIFVYLQSQTTLESARRALSINLGKGKCKWTPPKPMNVSSGDQSFLNTTTLLASYPGSGKRLTWRILEALTGKITGDDWDISENGIDSILTLKTSWPHPEGIWSWGDHMDQVILLIRNPRYAIPSYHTIRYELNFSTNWLESYNRKNNTYTQRPPVEDWENWRDAVFKKEMDRWVWYTNFWMNDGLRRNSTDEGPVQDEHCAENLLDCTPKAIIQFEKLMSFNPSIGREEMTKIGSVLDSAPNVELIEPEARPCVYNEVMSKRELYNKNRDGKGPQPDLKLFTVKQLEYMKTVMETLRDRYSAEPWTEDSNAIDLVDALNSYISEVETEYEFAVQREGYGGV